MRFCVKNMSRRRSKPVRPPPNPITCCFCGFAEEDEVEYGKLWNHDGIVTHYYCLLLSSNMEQNGNDNEGILGFMPADIQKELRRGKRLSCTHCKRTGATLGCCNSRCKRVFHLPCGLRAGSLHQFFGEFRSYCITHRIKQDIDEHIKQEAAAAGTVTCYICYEEVNPQNTIRTLWAPCCRKNAWFHRKCVQHLALSAGYFFKCPLCNNKQEFQQAMLEHGIFIPNQDASWELVPNAYQELLHRHNRCDAAECLCPKGRSHTGVNAKWELVLCRLCGSQGVHKACGHLKLASSIWECGECIAMLRKNNEAAPRLTNQIIVATNDTSEDESSSDSDISVGRNPSPLPETDHPDPPSPETTTPVKLRPGPRSFKLQQAVQNAKSAESTKRMTNTSVPDNRDILLSNKSDTVENTSFHENALSDEKSNGEASLLGISLAEKDMLSSKSTSIETNSTISEKSYLLPETVNAKSIEPRRREAEIIVIDSDDEVEIISVKPKQNILTTNDGTQIPIHSLSQVPGEPQRAEGDVKVAESTNSQPSKSSPSQSNVSFVTKSSFASDTSGPSNTLSQKSAPSLLPPSGVPKSPVTVRNAEDLELIVVSEPPKQSPVMTFKITNVTSLRQEDFTNTIQHSDLIGKINIAGSGPSDLLLSNDQHLRITQITNPINVTSSTTAFQLSTSTIKDSNVKRKTDDYTDKNLSDFPDKEVIESRKRARISDPKNTVPVQRNMSFPWSINFNDVNGVIPIVATSIPLTCSSNSDISTRYEQSTTTTLQTKLNELQTDSKGDVRAIYNPDIQNMNGIYKYLPGTGLTSSIQKKTKNNTSHVNLPNKGTTPIGSPENSLYMSKVTKMYGSMQPQTGKRVPIINMGGNNTNINGITQINQQLTVNESKYIPEISSRFPKPQTLTTTQQIPNSSENVAITSHSGYQSHENVNREMQRFSESGGILQKNLSATDVIFYNGLPRNCTEIPTGSTGNQPSINNVSKPSHLISQLTNGMQITSGCDGDAGSSPSAEAGFAHQAATKSPVHFSTESIIFTDPDAASDTGQSADDHSSFSTCISTNPTNVQRNISITTTGKYCDKPRLIPENVPLQNLKFHVLDPKIVQIVVHDTYKVNISTDTANLQNIQDEASRRSSIKKQKLLRSCKQRSNSISSKFGDIEFNRNISIHNRHDLSKTKLCSKIDDTMKEFKSPTGSPYNLVVPELKFNDSKVSSTPDAITDSKIKPSRVLEKICDTGSYYYNQRINSIREISTTDESLFCACFEGNDENSCIQHRENLSRKETVCPPAFSKNSSNLKNLCERNDNIIPIDKRKPFTVNMKESSVKKFKYKNSVQSLSSVDFCTKAHDHSNDEDENKRSIGLSRVSKCLVKSLDDSLKLNLSIDYYNNFKKIVDRSSELNCNKDLDANIRDSLKNNAKNVFDLDTINGSNKISFNSDATKSNKCFDTPSSNESKSQTVCANSIASTSCALRSSENINSDISLRKQINTAVKNRISSLIDENTSSNCQSDLGIKVRIDLNRIQHLIDSKPQLFDKKLLNEHGSEPSTNLVASRYFHNADLNNCSYFSKTQSSQSVQDMNNLHPRKRLKYSYELGEECSNSWRI